MQLNEQRSAAKLRHTLMTFQLLKALTKLTAGITKPIGLLLILLNAQVHIAQKAIAAPPLSIPTTSQVKQSQLPLCPTQLSAAIEAITNSPQFSRGRWGILIQPLSSNYTLYSRDAAKYFVPASNVKLLTTAAALYQLGANFRIRTSIYGNSNGYLYIVGRGDPSLTDAQLQQLAQQLNRRGIRQVRQLTAEDDYFRGAAINPNWEWEDVQADYGAPINSLILNQNIARLTLLPQQLGEPLRITSADATEATQLQIKNESVTAKPGEPAAINVSRELPGAVLKVTGSLSVNAKPESLTLAVTKPVDNFLQHFRRALAIEGIRQTTTSNPIISKLISVHQRASAVELAAVVSPPLSQLLIETNQNSNNLYAESLLRTLGAKASNTSSTTYSTDETGLQVVKAVLTKLGVDPTSYVMADGSGLSRHNLVSPEAIAQTLKAMARLPIAPIYHTSLPVAGVSGTLQSRLRDSAAKGIVQAKTGSMSGVAALSGYIYPPNYEPLVFSIIVNQSDQSAATIRQAIDQIMLLLTQLRRC